MQIFRRRLRSLTFIALFAMFGLALAPTVSHALSRLGGQGGFNPWAELCSTVGAGVSKVAAASAIATDSPAVPADPAKAGGAHLEHCPLCGTLSHAPALPITHAASLPAPAGAHFLPALFDHAPRPLFAWAVAQPRGPPTAA